MTNRLAHETSPYLKQHEKNPVDWYPWGKEALERARAEDKPILLSIGYSACHWCHVMAHESFENSGTARLMNEHFVNIKVDREERPDLDQIYQNVALAMTGGGGWPLTVFLTPDLRPFFGGTYFPPEDRWGRPGFPRLLQALDNAYRNDRETVLSNAEKLTEVITSVENRELKSQSKPSNLAGIEEAASKLASYVDPELGGIGSAPKFPNPMAFTLMWRMGHREPVLKTLDRMASGGIYDQLGGGFHRYSVDDTWSVPHFEKMLYDNALLLKLYSEVLLSDSAHVSATARLSAERRDLYLTVLEETVEYVRREMTSPEGVYYSAQDADTEGEEGKYFVWDPTDLAQILTSEETRVFALRYGVTPEGNFEHAKTVLFQALSMADVARDTGLEVSRVEDLIASARAKLFKARGKRHSPGLDNKVLTSWNGLMISGMVWASLALREFPNNERKNASDTALESARRAFEFLRANVTKKGESGESSRLFSTYQGGTPKLSGYLDDYAFMAMAAIDLAKVEVHQERLRSYLDASRSWLESILKHFKDSTGPGFYFTADDHEKLLTRPKSLNDQAIPSGSAVALGAMLALGESGYSEFRGEIENQLKDFFPTALANPFGSAEWLCFARLFSVGPVAVSGVGADQVCIQPEVFQKPMEEGASEGLLVCHRQTCSLPLAQPRQAQLAVQKALKSSA